MQLVSVKATVGQITKQLVFNLCVSIESEHMG